MESVGWLKEQVAAVPNSPTVIVTHHAPSRRSIAPKMQHHPLNSSYASDLDALVENSRARLWVHGHIHHCSDYRIGATRVLANPRGYPAEKVKEFNPSLVVDI
jgi:Icc-related predicted phosphoesterase